MLHITNGNSVELDKAGLPGEFEYWVDVLSEGPVPLLPFEELCVVRAGYIAQAFDANAAEVLADFVRRYARLRSAAEHDEIVLWFEHDLYDQFQLIQILDRLGSSDIGATRVTLIQTETYLGRMSPGELASLFPQRQPVTRAQFELASIAWYAFRSPEPGPLMSLLASDTRALPYLRAAMVRHAEEFPSSTNGLSRTERQILEAVASGAASVGDAFLASQRMEEAIFMGDDTFGAHVLGLAHCRKPLLHLTERASVLQGELRLTPAGADVLEGRADHALLNSIDRWRGGIHLVSPDKLWRWNGSALER